MTSHLILLALAVFLVLNDRLFIRLETAGSGLLRVMDIGIPVIAALLVVFSAKAFFRRMYTCPRVQFWLPYLGLALALPVLGVIANDFPPRTLLTSIVAVRAVSLLAIGAWLGHQPPRVRALAARWMVVCIALEAFIAGCQFITLQGLFDAPFLQWLYEWDIQTMSAYKDAYVITGRSSGTFLAANGLGPWSVFALWFSVTMLRGLPRMACAAASLLALALSQSRGSVIALLAAVVVGLASMPQMKRPVRFGLVMATVLALGLGFAVSGVEGTLQNGAMQGRFARGFAVLLAGPLADDNAQSRVEAWSDAIRFFDRHPYGTWGEPQMLLGHFIDNQYVSNLLQGSLPFLAALLLGLYGGIRQRKGRTGVESFLALSTVCLAVNSISAQPLAYTSISIYWLVLGYSSTAPAEKGRMTTARHLQIRPSTTRDNLAVSLKRA